MDLTLLLQGFSFKGIYAIFCESLNKNVHVYHLALIIMNMKDSYPFNLYSS